jgi:hypothetical protein
MKAVAVSSATAAAGKGNEKTFKIESPRGTGVELIV